MTIPIMVMFGEKISK